MTCLGYGAIKTTAKAPMAHRLRQVYDGLKEVFAKARPERLSLEEAFFAKNVQSALKLGMVRGVIMLAAQQEGIEVFEYSPLLIKQTVTGYGRAEKEQVRQMVKTQLRLDMPPDPIDASDALAAAITHIIHHAALGGHARAGR